MKSLHTIDNAPVAYAARGVIGDAATPERRGQLEQVSGFGGRQVALL